MGLTASLRQQHAEIVAIIGALNADLSGGKAGTILRGHLVALSGKLTVHLAAEDRMVYPQLRSSLDPLVAAMAQRFADEMGGLGAAFRSFMAVWSTGAAIDADRSGFTKAWTGVVQALSTRVEAEEHQLYPAADIAAGK